MNNCNRDIVGVAVDTPSIDYGQSSDFEVHQILGAANVWAVENLANAEGLSETGTRFASRGPCEYTILKFKD